MSSYTLSLQPSEALELVTSRTGLGVYASGDVLYKGAVFGRDSLETAEDILHIHPGLVRDVLLTLTALQGTVDNSDNEEEVGRIVHEYRMSHMDGIPLDGTLQHIFDELRKRWGGTETHLAYYGSVDATPLYMRLLGKYCEMYGEEILDISVERLNGEITTPREAFGLALDWLEKKLMQSSSGLVEYQRKNKNGIENQVWKDSKEFYVHRDGQLVNHERPVASIEVQGLSFDALLAASQVIPMRTKELIDTAIALRERTIELLWLPLEKYFALGIDHDDSGKLRIITTKTANPAALLDSHLLDGSEYRPYVEAIARTIMSKDFITNAGIRSRALSEGNLQPFWDYHGSFVTWPKETYDIAKGLRRHGFRNTAVQLENRILNLVLAADCYPEFVFVDKDGKVLLSQPDIADSEAFIVDSTNHPEKIQAWTVAAILGILTTYNEVTASLTETSWQDELTAELLANIHYLEPLLEKEKRNEHYPTYSYRLVRSNSQGAGFAVHNELNSVA